jgi:hypothetical protein
MKWGPCMVCGNCHDLDMSACPTGGDTQTLPSPKSGAVGWACPVCGMGNAPFAMKCGHCRPDPQHYVTINGIRVPST